MAKFARHSGHHWVPVQRWMRVQAVPVHQPCRAASPATGYHPGGALVGVDCGAAAMTGMAGMAGAAGAAGAATAAGTAPGTAPATGPGVHASGIGNGEDAGTGAGSP